MREFCTSGSVRGGGEQSPSPTSTQLLLNHYGREKEIFPALSMIINRSCHVKLEGSGLLRVRLRRFKNQEIDYAARHLCEDLNALGPTTLDKHKFPMHFEVE